MKFRNVIWGMILILIGILFTLENLNIIDFTWYNLWRLWPVALVLWGVSIIPVKNIIKIILVTVILGASTIYMLQEPVYWHDNEYSISFGNDNDNDDTKSKEVSQEFTIPYEDSAIVAKLDMEIAASKFVLVDESYDLIDFEKHGSSVYYKYSVTHTDSVVDVNIYIEDEVNISGHHKNRIDMSLNPQPIWDLDFEIGAADANLDLSGLKVSDITIEGGAAAIKVKLGDENPETNMSIETGASAIKVLVPKNAYCELDINAVLSGKTITGFQKVERGQYKTDNYDEANSRIYITVETAVSSYSIIRY